MKADYNVFIYFQVNLLRCIQRPRRMKQTQKTNLLKKLDMVVMENYNVLIYFQMFYILLYIYNLDQAMNVINLTKSQQIKTRDFITVSFQHYTVLKCLQLLFHPSKIYQSLAFIAVAFELSTFCIVLKIVRLLRTNFPVTFVIYQWQYCITVNNNYLPLGKYLLFIKLFNNYLALIKIFTVNEIIYRQ